MKQITNGFKTQIKSLGRQLDSVITYTIDGVTATIGSEMLNSVTPAFNGTILKSTMKQLDVDILVDVPIGTEINYKFGVLVGNTYEYIDYGNYIVYSNEKQEDTNSYKLVCYDKMLYSMKKYEPLDVTYPITIRNYLIALCTKVGLQFANSTDTFPNYNKTINSDLYKDLDYTYRDIFDELSQVTASTICINKQDKVELRYITETNDTIDEEYLKDINVNFGQKYGKVNSIVLSRSGESDNVYLQDEDSVATDGLCEIKIVDNQIMNFNDRADYLTDILDKLDGLEYYINDYLSTGVCYYELCDRYSVSIGESTYSCVMFNDEVLVTQGLEENIYCDMPDGSETDYTKADKDDRRINQAFIIVNKQNQTIESLTIQVQVIDTAQQNNYQELNTKFNDYVPENRFVTLENSVSTLQTNTYSKIEVDTKLTDGSVTKVSSTSGTFDANGLTIEKTDAKTKGNFNETGLSIIDNTGSTSETLLFAGYNAERNETIVETANINVTHYFNIGSNSRLEDYEDGTGVFDI